MADELKVYYNDDPDPEKAGQGLAMAPLLEKILGTASNYWLMTPAEQVGLIYLLEQINPCVGIEIGVRFGGSLQVMAKYCDCVYALDSDPDVPEKMEGRYPNVEYLTGLSSDTLPPLIDRLKGEEAKLAFVLVDGDHSSEGVRADINQILRYRPVVPLYIVLHDSFNPICRQGIRTAGWAESPYVHAVELDFIPGLVNPSPAFRGQLWGGLALAILLPEPRQDRFEVTGRCEFMFQKVSEVVPLPEDGDKTDAEPGFGRRFRNTLIDWLK